MQDDRASEAGLELLLVPRVVLTVVFIRQEFLGRKDRCGVLDALLLLAPLGRCVLRLLLRRGLTLVLQVEAYRQLEVDLQGAALVLPFERVVNLDIDFGPIESAVTVVERPRLAEPIQRVFKRRLRFVPLAFRTQSIFWPGRELQFVGEAEDPIDVLKEVEHI